MAQNQDAECIAVFKECEVVYKNVKHPEFSKGDRCYVKCSPEVELLAEILEIRTFKCHGDQYEFLVHFEDFADRKFDTWVPDSDIKKVKASDSGNVEDPSSKDGGRRMTRRTLGASSESQTKQTKKLTQEDEVRQYEEYTKVKYISEVHVGGHLISTWYFSPFPKEMLKYKRLHFCPMCLKVFALMETYAPHYYDFCSSTSPPGILLYTTGELSIFEVDGAEDKQWCQVLSLLGKCFIKEKTLAFVADQFMFYVLCETKKVDGTDRQHLVGYFSKEKVSEEDNNLACLVVLPPFMSKGYGNLLIDMSYQLTKRERKTGSPEKPLSDLGKRSYLNYWTFIVAKYLNAQMEKFRSNYEKQKKPGYKSYTRAIEAVSKETGIHIDDVKLAMRNLPVCKDLVVENSLVITPASIRASYEALKEKYRRKGLDGPRLVRPELIVWQQRKKT